MTDDTKLSDWDGPYANSRVAVLGVSGFIGSWVAEALGRRCAKVALLVRNVSRPPRLESHQGRIIPFDANDPKGLEAILRHFRPMITFNLAGYGVDPAERDPAASHRVNCQLVERLSAIIAEIRQPDWPGQDLVHVGSALEYGNLGGSLHEDLPGRPTTVYGETKLEGTLALARICQASGTKGLTARLFTVYGAGEHPHRLLPSLVASASTHSTLDLTDGEQRRDFTYVGDVSEGLLRLGLCKAKSGTIVNLCTGRLTSVRQFAQIAAEILGIPCGDLRFGTLPTRSEEMHHGAVNLDRLRGLVGWIPTTSPADGIRQTVRMHGTASEPAETMR